MASIIFKDLMALLACSKCKRDLVVSLTPLSTPTTLPDSTLLSFEELFFGYPCLMSLICLLTALKV